MANAANLAPNTPLARFAHKLEGLDERTLLILSDIPENRSAHERAEYLAAWQRAKRTYDKYRLSGPEAAAMSAVNDAGPTIAERACGDAADRRVPLLAIGVARALLLRPLIGEAAFLALTTEWRRVVGANSLR